MSEMQEGIQMAMMTGQAMAFVVDKGVTLTRQILEALAKLMKMSALSVSYTHLTLPTNSLV